MPKQKARVQELNAKRSAAYLGMSRHRFKKLKDAGAFTLIPIGSINHFLSDELDAFLDSAGRTDEERVAIVRQFRKLKKRRID
jgi:hypothetical protein